MTKDEALKMALECAERCESLDGMYGWSDTIDAIKEALAQPQREWVGLTAEEIQEVWVEHGLDDCDVEGFARAVETKLEEKNTL